jgi:hypothetical protein
MMHLSWLYECLLLEIIGMTSANKERKLVFNVQFQFKAQMIIYGSQFCYRTFRIT